MTGDRIAELMRQIGWALGEVARRLGVSDRPVGSRRMPLVRSSHPANMRNVGSP